MSLKVFYAGSPEPSAALLETLIESGKSGNLWEIVGVLTNPPSAKKRSATPTPTAVSEVAQKHGIPVFTPEHLDSTFREQIAPLNADIFVCFDYGHIFGPKFLSLFALGGVNLHPSLLPKYRGCTPVPAAILNGDEKTGVSLQKIALAIDEGDILDCREIALDGTETTESLMATDGAVVKNGAEMIQNVLTRIAQSENGGAFVLPAGKKQTGEASYTPFISKQDGKIDWNCSAAQIERKIRAYTPWPQCFTKVGDKELKILSAHVFTGDVSALGDVSAMSAGTVAAVVKNDGIVIKCKDGFLSATVLQWQAKKAADFKSFANGARGFVGSVCG